GWGSPPARPAAGRGCAPPHRRRCPPAIPWACSSLRGSPARSARGGDGFRHLLDDPCLVDGRRVDLEHLEVVRAVELVVHDPGRLQDAIALRERVLALALVDDPDPAVEHVEHLEVTEVLVQSGRVQIVIAGRLLLDPDRVGPELAMRRMLDPEIAVFHEAPEPALVNGVLGEARAEQLLGLAHLDSSCGALGAGDDSLGAANASWGPRTRTPSRPGWR